MRLHRDPGRGGYSRDTAERRWAWWYIVLLERSVISIHPWAWIHSSLMVPEDGNCLCSVAIASHHFEASSYCPPELDGAGRFYIPNVALLRLAFILREITENAVSLRPITYESFNRNDQSLVEWLETFPQRSTLIIRISRRSWYP